MALARLRLGEADARDLRIGVDRPRHRRVADRRLVAARVLGRNLALAERGVRELPVAGAVADGVDVRDRRAPVLVGRDPRAPVELDADLLEPEPLDERAAADRDEHQVGLDGLAVAEVDASAGSPSSSTPLHCLPSWSAIPRLPNGLRELLRRVGVLLRDQRVEHLDDRHLGAEALEDRRELAADDAAAEDDEPARHLGLREQAGGVDAAGRVDPVDRRA